MKTSAKVPQATHRFCMWFGGLKANGKYIKKKINFISSINKCFQPEELKQNLFSS